MRFLTLFIVCCAALHGAGIVSSDPRFQLPPTDEGVPGQGTLRRHDWFQRIWTEQRTKFAELNSREEGRILFLGDSITQGWGDVASFFPGLPVANRGISGDTTRGVLFRLEDDVIAAKPKAVVLLLGTNDIEEAGTPDQIAHNMRLILERLRSYNESMPVILCRILPSSASKSRPATRIRQVNELYAEITRDMPQVTLLDTYSLFADVQGDAKYSEMPDLLHPNTAGYAKWGRALIPIFETLGLAPTWPDNFTPEAGFIPLFNGKDLTGWKAADGTVLDGQPASPENRYKVVAGRLVVTSTRKGQGFTKLETVDSVAGDYVLRLEFRASPNADSGIFIRGVQLQCRDYPIAGPWTGLRYYRPLDWNDITITVRGGVARATCNGELLVDAMPIPENGTIGLESDRGQIEYRRIRIKQL